MNIIIHVLSFLAFFFRFEKTNKSCYQYLNTLLVYLF